MKGTFFQKPMEFNIEAKGESWTQNSLLGGSLTIKNHSTDKLELAQLGCHLCVGSNKKVKAKDPSAFNLYDNKLFEQTHLGSKESLSFDFSFKLGESCPITDSTNSLYLVVGNIQKPFDTGILQLNITPAKEITNFIEIFETYFKFKFKSLKSKKDYIEAKVVAPSSKDWTALQSLTVFMRLQDAKLEIKFNAKVKKISFDKLTAGQAKDTTLDIVKIMDKEQYSGFGGSANIENIKFVIQEVLEQLKVKPLGG